MATCFGHSDHHLAILQELKANEVESFSMGSHYTYNKTSYNFANLDSILGKRSPRNLSCQKSLLTPELLPVRYISSF